MVKFKAMTFIEWSTADLKRYNVTTYSVEQGFTSALEIDGVFN